MRKVLIALVCLFIAIPAYAEKPITLYVTVVYNKSYHQLWELSMPRKGGHVVLENDGLYRCESTLIDLRHIVWKGCPVMYNYTRGVKVTQDIWAIVVILKGTKSYQQQLAWNDTIDEATKERFRRERVAHEALNSIDK